MLVLFPCQPRRAGAFPQHLGCSARLYPDAPLAKDFDTEEELLKSLSSADAWRGWVINWGF